MDKRVIQLIHDKPAVLGRSFGFVDLTDELHGEWIRWMVFGTEDGMLQSHRGSYKTTCLAVSISFWLLLHPNQRCKLIRKTDTDVAEVMEVISKIIEHPKFQALSIKLYGEGVRLTTSTQSAIDTSIAIGVSGAFQVEGLGIGASITGKHAELIVADDIVNIKDRVSAAERKATKLAYQELHNIKNRGGRIIVTGTPWHKDDAYSKIKNVYRYDCYSTGLVTQEELQTLRESMSTSMFAANYELKHIADEDAIFKTEPQYFSLKDKANLHGCTGHIDAAYGGSDRTAFTVMKKGSDGTVYAFGTIWKKPVTECLSDIKKLHTWLRCGTVWCEDNADKGLLRKLMKKDYNIPSMGYHEKENKFIKISTTGKSGWNKMKWLDNTNPEYMLEILDYTENAEHDDAPDSYSSCLRQINGGLKVKMHKEGL